MRVLKFLSLAILSTLVAGSTALYAQDDKPQDEAKPAHQDEVKPKQEQEKDQHAQPSKGGHIPDKTFKTHFGHSHTFSAKTVIVRGQTTFVYGGYNFQLVDAWPAGWAYTDTCYIDFIDGEYFIFDVLHPGVQVTIFVVL
jgi:Ni/Co efflux regulator RcnB